MSTTSPPCTIDLDQDYALDSDATTPDGLALYLAPGSLIDTQATVIAHHSGLIISFHPTRDDAETALQLLADLDVDWTGDADIVRNATVGDDRLVHLVVRIIRGHTCGTFGPG